MAFQALNAAGGANGLQAHAYNTLPANIARAFEERPELSVRILQALNNPTPGLGHLFEDIASYVEELRSRATHAAEGANGPAAKKRKLDGELATHSHTATAPGGGRGDSGTASSSHSIEGKWGGGKSAVFEGTSFSVPQRKKLVLEISPSASEGIRALNDSTPGAKPEFGVLYRDVEHIVCLPVPEKAQPAHNFCIFPRNGDGLGEGGGGAEPVVWTAPDTNPKTAVPDAPTPSAAIREALKRAGVKVLEPSADEFQSEVPQAYRKGEKVYHVKAFRGSKDGFLFFLPEGIVWGFKKPLIFFSFSAIDSISYTSVLQRTFNLVIAARPSLSSSPSQTEEYQEQQQHPPQEFEFSMLDQADFAGIDAYIKRHGLQDASMAAERRAKKYNINGVKGGTNANTADAVAGGGDEGEEESELRKAEREAEIAADDDEDEEEDENFDPGSEGESEGSGTSDSEDGEGEGNGDGGGGGDDDDDEDDDNDNE